MSYPWLGLNSCLVWSGHLKGNHPYHAWAFVLTASIFIGAVSTIIHFITNFAGGHTLTIQTLILINSALSDWRRTWKQKSFIITQILEEARCASPLKHYWDQKKVAKKKKKMRDEYRDFNLIHIIFFTSVVKLLVHRKFIYWKLTSFPHTIKLSCTLESFTLMKIFV